MSMLNTIRKLGALFIVLGAGCASTPVRIADTVGPAPDLPATEGQLVVHTEVFRRGTPDLAPDTQDPYDILDARGVPLRTVASPDDEAPIITLRAGDYIVRGRGLGRASVEVPVRIVAGKTTEVHLDREGDPRDAHASGAVFGPDGSFVGPRATPAR